MQVTPLVQFTMNLAEAKYLIHVLDVDPRGTDKDEALSFIHDAVTSGLDEIVFGSEISQDLSNGDDFSITVEITLPESGLRALASFISTRNVGIDEEQGVDPKVSLKLSAALNDALLDVRAFGKSEPDARELLSLAREFEPDVVRLAQARGEDAAEALIEVRETHDWLEDECIDRGLIDGPGDFGF